MPTLVVTKTQVCTMEINDDESAMIHGGVAQNENLEDLVSEFDCHWFETIDTVVEVLD